MIDFDYDLELCNIFVREKMLHVNLCFVLDEKQILSQIIKKQPG